MSIVYPFCSLVMSRPTLCPVYRYVLFPVYPVEVCLVVAPDAFAAVGAVALPFGIAAVVVDALPALVLPVAPEGAVGAAASGFPGIAAVVVDALPAPALPVFPEGVAAVAVAEPLEKAVGVAVGVSSPGHPNYFASPNVGFFASCSSFGEPAVAVFAGSSMDVRPSDAVCSRFSSRRGPLCKKRERFDSGSSLSRNSASDTSDLPMDATTTPRRKRCPHWRQGRRRHRYRVSRLTLAVRQIPWAAAGERLHPHLPLPPWPSRAQALP